MTVAQLALAWVLRNPVVTTAMVGARVPAEIEENVLAAQVTLSDADVAQIEATMSDVAGRVEVFRPFSSAMEVWS
jgi:L-glyceraldehyde 3-phosphate reductase